MTTGTQDPAEGPRWEGLDQRRLVDVAEDKPFYLLKGRNGSQMRLSASAHQLLKLRNAGVSAAEIAEALSRNGQPISSEELEAKYQALLARIEAIENQSRDNPRGFWIRIRLLPESAVVKLSSYLALAFRPAVAAGLLMVLAVAFWMLDGGSRMDIDSPASFWIGYGLLLVSIVFHEFGHASACAYYGARPSDIGFTFFKFDGYWVVADALGITNLSSQPLRIARHVVQRLRGQKPAPLPWSNGLTAFLVIYSALTVAVWVFFIWAIAPRIWQTVHPFPSQVAAYISGSPNADLSEILMSAFIVVPMVYICWRIARSTMFQALVAGGRRIGAWISIRRKAHNEPL